MVQALEKKGVWYGETGGTGGETVIGLTGIARDWDTVVCREPGASVPNGWPLGGETTGGNDRWKKLATQWRQVCLTCSADSEIEHDHI